MRSEILQKLTQILKNNTLLADVYNYERIQTDSDPFAIIVPSGNEGDYQTTEENVRVYAYRLILFVSRNKLIRTEQKADEVLAELEESVMDDIDKDYAFETIGIPQKTGYTFLQIFATPSAWGYAMPEDEYRVATLNIRALVSVSLNQIS
jgi:hypothetical protein